MRILSLALFILLGCFQAFGCSDIMKPYELECKAQDRFQSLSTEFKTFSITITDLKGFKIPKALGKISYFSAKNDLLNHSEITLSKNKEWPNWNNGQKFVKKLSPIYLEFNDIMKLHKILFGSINLLDQSSDTGKIRTNNGETNPKLKMSCSEKVLNDKILKTLSDYDLTSIEGYPLLSLKNINVCKDSKYNSADLYFYKGASMRIELSRWMIDLNDMIARYENGNAPTNISPYHYFSDMRRWFLAIRPFNSSNEQVVDALIDYSAKRLQLPSLPLIDSVNSIFLTVAENRDHTVKQLQENLTFFEGCLFETKMKLISSECQALK
ncbi:MAG: hypothetical protein PHY93_03875 [Bacteriovorax sp.]|nr:hypothetical protein [Bacteriovorax sp.]